jgi:DNA polymerase
MQKNIRQLLESLLLWLRFQRESGADLVRQETVKCIEKIQMADRNKNTDSKIRSSDLSAVKHLSELQALVERCTLCDLSKTRNRVVFGEGNTKPLLMIIGEAPGREEDLKGRPFVGRSGELLTKMLRAVSLDRNEVFITSVIKCRPPGNRTPHRDEISTCMPYLRRQITLLSPRLIMCLGGVAAQSLLKNKKPLSGLREKFYDYHGITVMVTYHPAYLLRFGGMKQKDLKRKAWHDLQMLQREYEKLKQETS